MTPLRDRFILANLPGAESRILEIGCGDGRLAHRMHRAGHAVTGVDPRAPKDDGPVFHRCAFEDVALPAGSFDVGVASMSLHHMAALGPVLDKAFDLLRPGGIVIVAEFGWERIDEATGRWYADHLPTKPGTGEGFLAETCRRWQAEGGSFERHRAQWAVKDEMLHDSATMVRELRARFDQRYFALAPYLHDGLTANEDDEAEAIRDGRIQAVGVHFVGSRRTLRL